MPRSRVSHITDPTSPSHLLPYLNYVAPDHYLVNSDRKTSVTVGNQILNSLTKNKLSTSKVTQVFKGLPENKLSNVTCVVDGVVRVP